MAVLLVVCLSTTFAMDTALHQASGQVLSDAHSVKLNGMREETFQIADPDYLNSYNASGRQDRRKEAGKHRDATTVSQDRIKGFDQRGNDRYQVQVDENTNFCFYLSKDEYQDLGTCDLDAANEADCNQKFRMLPDANFTVCTYDEATNKCTDGNVYSCPWTAHMLALERAQNASTDSCFGDILESKRSLDGLLKWVNETYMELMVQTEVIRENNYTIYLAIEDQQRAEHSMIDCKIHCDNHAIATNETTLGEFEHQLHLLEDIANPEIRSKVKGALGHYEAEAARRFEEAKAEAATEWSNTDANDMRRKVNIKVRETGGDDASLVQLDEVHSSDSVRSQKWSMMNLLGFGQESEEDICHERRENLTILLRTTWNYYKKAYGLQNTAIQEGRTECHDMCEGIYHHKIHFDCDAPFPTYTYDAHGSDNNKSTFDSGTFVHFNSTNETNPCVNDRIAHAAGKISDAQSEIAVLEPRLHDLEHAVNRMRSHLRHQNQTCTLDQSVSDRLYQIHLITRLISECPGRNDFVLKIPHWGEPPVPTPSPTPWFDRESDDVPENMAGKYPAEAFEPVVPAGFIMESDATEE